MPNKIKFSTSSVNGSLSKGNAKVVAGGLIAGPTHVTGFYNGITPPVNGYTFYMKKEGFVEDGLVLFLDAGNKSSYRDDLSSTEWWDLSGYGNDGVLINGVTYDSGNTGSFVFDGSNDYVDTGFIPIFVHNNATHIAWMKYSAFGAATGCHNSRRFYMGLSSSSVFGWGVCNANNWSSGAPHSIALGEYVMLAVVADNGTARGYINGNDTNITFAYTKDAQYSPNQSYKVGSWTGTGGFVNGNIATTIIYNRALSESEIQQNYNISKNRFGL